MNIKEATTDHPILQVLGERWSPYGFDDRPVSAADLRSLFEAARWAASSYNEQPWNYLVATKEDPDEFGRLLSCLVEANQIWAKAAPVLALGVAPITAVNMIVQFLTFEYWGRLSDRFGNKKILNICGWAVGAIPILWRIDINDAPVGNWKTDPTAQNRPVVPPRIDRTPIELPGIMIGRLEILSTFSLKLWVERLHRSIFQTPERSLNRRGEFRRHSLHGLGHRLSGAEDPGH